MTRSSDSLRRQARQSQRYRGLGAEIRRYEALAKLIAWRAAEAGFVEAERAFSGLTGDVAERTRLQAETATAQAMAAADLPSLRDAEARAGAALHRLTVARDALAGEEKRAEARAAELRRRIAQMGGDIEREHSLVADAAQTIERLDVEAETLAAQDEAGDARAEAEAREAEAAEALAEAEAALAAAQGATADFTAKRNALGYALDEEIKRWRRFEEELAALKRDRDALPGGEADEAAFDDASAALEELMETLAEAEATALEAEEAHAAAREAEARARAPLAEAERLAQRLETEARTLEKLLGSASGGAYPPVLEEIVAERGYETALGAALGDDLDASTAEGAPARWAGARRTATPLCPEASRALAAHIEAPPQLARRLAQIGVVARADGPALAARLKPGQRLVSREGDLWRWDGFAAAAEAPTPAARRLVEKNRLGELIEQGEAARERAEALKQEAARLAAALREAANAETAARGRVREARAAAGRRARKTFRRRAPPRADAHETRRAGRGAGARHRRARRGGRAAQRGGRRDAGAAARRSARRRSRAGPGGGRRGALAPRRGQGLRPQPRARTRIARRAAAGRRRGAALVGRAARQGGGAYRRNLRAPQRRRGGAGDARRGAGAIRAATPRASIGAERRGGGAEGRRR